MPRIILHIGPEKCGSTTIQSAISGPDGPLSHLVQGVVLNPFELVALDTPQPEPHVIAGFHRLMEEALAGPSDKPVILSYEVIFQSLHILSALAEIARSHCDDVVAVAYARRQSDYLVSTFGQWHFRSPARLSEVAGVLSQHGIEPGLFWGVERHLIACIIGGWHHGRHDSGNLFFDWSESVPLRAEALSALGVPLRMGLVPRPGHDVSLTEDFALRAGLEIDTRLQEDSVKNPSFDQALIEGIVNAIEQGYEMPGPHEANNFLRESSAMDLSPLPALPFLARLKARVDTAFAARNRRFARANGLCEAYFEPDTHVDQQTILAELEAEVATRAAVPAALRQRQRQERAALARIAWGWHRHLSGRPRPGSRA